MSYFAELYSFYKNADHYWDFTLPDNIVDNITSQHGSVSGTVIARISPTGTGLRVTKGAEITLKPEFGIECPVDPSRCTEGLTVSMFVKVINSTSDFKRMLGNSDMQDFQQITGHKGFVVGVNGSIFQIFVVSENYVCSSDTMAVRRNLWSHLVFSWKDPGLQDGGLEIYRDGARVPNTDCNKKPDSNRTLSQNITLGSRIRKLAFTTEFDNLAIWYKSFNQSRLQAPWTYIRGKLF